MRDAMAGIGLGLLVGLLVGLSAVPVVASVVAALLAVLATFFGFGVEAGPVSVKASAARVAGFAFAMSGALLFGILARTHGWLEPGIDSHVRAFAAAGFPEDQARDLAAYKQLGLLLGSLEGQERPETPGQGSGLLFSKEMTTGCSALEQNRFQSPADRVQAMRDFGPPFDAVDRVMAESSGADPGVVSEAVWQALCGGEAL
jgi:hypothetical protein